VLLNPQVNTGVRLSSLRERAQDRRRALSAVGGGHHRDTATLSSHSNGSGRTMRARELELNTDQVPTAQGGKAWYASTVKAVLES
jgi:hypothetical protein